MITEVSKQYARALFELISDDDKKQGYDNLQIISEVLLTDEVLKVFEHPSITLDQKKEIIKRSLDHQIDDLLINFLFVLVDHERLSELDNICLAYKDLLDELLKQQEAVVYTKYPLTDNKKAELISVLNKKYNKTIILKEIIDSRLVGGIKVVIKNEEFDDTALSKLQKIKDILKG